MPDPGYYKLNYRALRLTELLRMAGVWFFPVALLGRFFTKPIPAGWFPAKWEDLECTESDLSERFLKVVAPHRKEFERLGFTQIALVKNKRILSPVYRDGGGVYYLDAQRQYLAQLSYIKAHSPSSREKNIEETSIAFTAVFSWGCMVCAHETFGYDTLPEDRVYRYRTANVATAYERFLKHLGKQKGEPRQFSTLETLRTWFNRHSEQISVEWVGRELLVPMTEDEVAAAKAKLEARD